MLIKLKMLALSVMANLYVTEFIIKNFRSPHVLCG